MFGLNDNKDQNQDLSTTHATVVTQSNMAAPGPQPAQLPDEWHAPSNLNAQALAAATVGPAEPAVDSSPPQTPILSKTDKFSSGNHTGDKEEPTVSLDNAYIAADPPHINADDTDSPKPTAASLVNSDSADELLKMKHQALQNLAPLVDHLDQSPEEKFKTTMMLIQASDNAELVKEAYQAANQIPDEKTRAQALLDVVNEINYFTHHGPVAELSY
jgi:hypothetical protein